MGASASQIFNFLERHSSCSVERHEVLSADFSVLRRSLRLMIMSFRESDDAEAHETADRLQRLLSEWLTVPVQFNDTTLNGLQLLGEPDAFGRRWGRDMRSLYDDVKNAMKNLQQYENPVCAELREIILNLRDKRQVFKIFCHRTAPLYFNLFLKRSEDLLLEEDAFLHSWRDYRETEPFDVLIKVGPLRSRGWGAAPDALLTAPRFATLVQVVWSGCGDEPGFGYDPVEAVAAGESLAADAATHDYRAGNNGITWTSKIIRSGSEIVPVSGNLADADEFQIFRDWNQKRNENNRRATLVQIDEEHGILYPPFSGVLSFDPAPDAQKPIDHRMPDETLVEGMFVVRPVLQDVNLDGPQAEHGYFSQIWKARLKETRQKDPDGLIIQLSKAGLDLVHLGSALSNWCKSPSTVIHAPQQKRHFEILIRVLGIDFAANVLSETKRKLSWEYAWQEICRSRGEAIHAGFLGHEYVEEKLFNVLAGLLPDIRRNAESSQGFSLLIPDVEELRGVVLFNRVRAIEDGFSVPETELKLVHELSAIEQWRA